MAKRQSPRFSRLIRFLTEDRSAEDEYNRLERFAHFWVLVAKSFARNRCPVRAASLSYTTLLALIPLLAVAISVTSSLLKSEGEQKIYEAVDKFVSNVIPPAELNTNGLPVSIPATNSAGAGTITNSAGVATNALPNGTAGAAENGRIVTAQKEVAKYIHNFLKNTRSGALGVTGMIVLVFIAIQMLSSVEATFNDIWGVTRGRSWVWRIVLYWATITLGPLLLIGALGLVGGSHAQAVRNFAGRLPVIGTLVFDLLPMIVLWLMFALAYLLIPNTKVRFGAALVGAVVGAVLWHLNSVFGFLYVSRVVTNSKIYGSLGLIPVFMAGLYLFWLILLFGSQVAYAFQNRKAYSQEKLVENVNQRGREFIALRLMTCIGQRFQHGDRAITLQEISVQLGIPTRLAQQVLRILLGARLVSEIAGAEPAYTPGRPLDAINAYDVLQAMRAGGGQEFHLRGGPTRAEVYGEFARIEEAERAAASSVTMLALINRLPERRGITAPNEEEPAD